MNESQNQTQKHYDGIELLDQETLGMLKEYAKDNPELVKDIYDSFAPEAEELVARVIATAAAEDIEGLRKSAHSLAGISGSIGAKRLQVLNSDIENAIKNGDNTTAVEHALLVEPVYRQLLKMLEDF